MNHIAIQPFFKAIIPNHLASISLSNILYIFYALLYRKDILLCITLVVELERTNVAALVYTLLMDAKGPWHALTI